MNETYEFAFQRGQLIKFVGGLLSLVVLVFSAGLLTGIALQMREAPPTLVAQTEPHPQPVSAPVLAAPVLVTPPPAPVADEDKPAIEPSSDEASQIDENAPAVEDTPAESKSAELAEAGKFAVQFGAFLRRENAGVLARTLTRKGYDADVVEREDSHGRTWYLVRYGLFSNRAEATAAAVELKARENLDALVRPTNSM
jgi:cell division septation protein DedD